MYLLLYLLSVVLVCSVIQLQLFERVDELLTIRGVEGHMAELLREVSCPCSLPSQSYQLLCRTPLSIS